MLMMKTSPQKEFPGSDLSARRESPTVIRKQGREGGKREGRGEGGTGGREKGRDFPSAFKIKYTLCAFFLSFLFLFFWRGGFKTGFL
jgi:ribosomal protein L15